MVENVADLMASRLPSLATARSVGPPPKQSDYNLFWSVGRCAIC